MIFGSQKWRAHDPMPSTSSIYDTVVTAILFHLQIQDMKLDMKPLISVKLMKWLNCRGDWKAPCSYRYVTFCAILLAVIFQEVLFKFVKFLNKLCFRYIVFDILNFKYRTLENIRDKNEWGCFIRSRDCKLLFLVLLSWLLNWAFLIEIFIYLSRNPGLIQPNLAKSNLGLRVINFVKESLSFPKRDDSKICENTFKNFRILLFNWMAMHFSKGR